MIAWKNRLLARNQTAYGETPGLYLMNHDCSKPEPILYNEIWQLISSDKYVLTVERIDPSEPRKLHLHDLESLNVLWSKSILNEAATLDNDEVFYLSDESAHGVLTKADSATGQVYWHSQPLPESISEIYVVQSIIICYHIDGCSFYKRSDGSCLGHTELACGPPLFTKSRVFVSAPSTVLCAALIEEINNPFNK